jgi:prepilin signal peptidase PulO-like enzyme (type II secretory pathway)
MTTTNTATTPDRLEDLVGDVVCHRFPARYGGERAWCGVPRAEQPYHSYPMRVRDPLPSHCPRCGHPICPRCLAERAQATR